MAVVPYGEDVYKGTKFTTVFVEKKVPNSAKTDKTKELIKWNRVFHEHGLAPPYDTPKGKGSMGNLSMRTGKGFLIKSSYNSMEAVKPEELVEVIDVNMSEKTVKVIGTRAPSSETMMHYAIYRERKEVNAVFHGHDQAVLDHAKELGVPVTPKEIEYGTPEFANAAVKALSNKGFVILKNHGFIAVGATMEDAGALALGMHNKALKM